MPPGFSTLTISVIARSLSFLPEMLCAELKAFPSGMVTEISTYEEYLDSSCKLVLLIADCSYVTLYCKDPDMLEALFQQAVQCGFHRVDYVTDENDARTGLSVW